MRPSFRYRSYVKHIYIHSHKHLIAMSSPSPSPSLCVAVVLRSGLLRVAG